MINLHETQKWIAAVFIDPNSAAVKYSESLAGWQNSFVHLVLPITAVAYLIAGIISIFSDSLTSISSAGLWLMTLIWGLGWTFAIAFIFDYLGGTFGGERNYSAAYAVVALAIIPSLFGTAISPLPWLGWLLAVIASIYSLILAYRFIPVLLKVPENARVKHFVASVVVAVVVNIAFSMMIGSQVASSTVEDHIADLPAIERDSRIGGGLLGGVERQAKIAEVAANDTFTPPADGKVTRDQLSQYVRAKERTAELRRELSTNLRKRMDTEKPSFSEVYSGIGGAMRMTTAEMEVVKTAGGNWAEHQWVDNQLTIASVQRDLNDTVRHNYALYEEVAERLSMR